MNILHYYRIKHLITKFIERKNDFSKVKLERPHVPFHINVLLNPKKGSKQFYTILCCDDFERPNNEKKWPLELNVQLHSEFWRTSYKICFKAVLDNSYIWFQYRTLHRILGTQDHSHKLNLSESFTCGICGQQHENITHLFARCQIVLDLWKNITKWFELTLFIKIKLNELDFIFGYQKHDENV